MAPVVKGASWKDLTHPLPINPPHPRQAQQRLAALIIFEADQEHRRVLVTCYAEHDAVCPDAAAFELGAVLRNRNHSIPRARILASARRRAAAAALLARELTQAVVSS